MKHNTYPQREFGLVEESYRNSGETVFIDYATNSIYVCFGGTRISRDKHNITFKDCSLADILKGQKEYYGEVFSGSKDITYHLEDALIPHLTPIMFYKGECVKVVNHRS